MGASCSYVRSLPRSCPSHRDDGIWVRFWTLIAVVLRNCARPSSPSSGRSAGYTEVGSNLWWRLLLTLRVGIPSHHWGPSPPSAASVRTLLLLRQLHPGHPFVSIDLVKSNGSSLSTRWTKVRSIFARSSGIRPPAFDPYELAAYLHLTLETTVVYSYDVLGSPFLGRVVRIRNFTIPGLTCELLDFANLICSLEEHPSAIRGSKRQW